MLNNIYIHRDVSAYAYFIASKVLIDSYANQYEVDLFDVKEILTDYLNISFLDTDLLYNDLGSVYDANPDIEYTPIRLGGILDFISETNTSSSNIVVITKIFKIDSSDSISRIVVMDMDGKEHDITYNENLKYHVKAIDSSYPELGKIDFICFMLDTVNITGVDINRYIKQK